MPVATPVSNRKKELDSEIIQKENELAQFTKNNPFTGAINDDIGKLLATRQTREGLAAAKKSRNDENNTAAILRGQDLDHKINLSQVDIAKEKNDIDWDKLNVARDEINVNKLAVEAHNNKTAVDRELGLGELDINRSVLSMQQDRYNNVTKPSDRLSMAERAATARVGTAEAGFELSDDLFKETSKYLKNGKPAEGSKVAAPMSTPAAALDPLTSATKVQQFSGYEPYPDVLEAAPITHYGKGILPQIGGAAVEGIKLLGRTAARITAADPLSPSRRYKRKVNK